METTTVLWSDLTVAQIRNLLLLDDPTVEKIFSNHLRNREHDFSEDEITTAWQQIIKKAERLKINLTGPSEANEIIDVIYHLLSKEFPN